VGEASERRKAENEAIFRDANERLKDVRDRLAAVAGRTPFFCECEDPVCREVVQLSHEEYEAVRVSAETFLIVRGHPTTGSVVVEEHDDYVVVAKTGDARRVAEQTDPRSAGGAA
jgi:hypothetical protein